MIQRIQSVFLFLVAASLVSILFLPIWGKAEFGVSEVNLNAYELVYSEADDDGLPQVVMVKDTYWIAVLALMGAAVALFSIAQFKKRLLQIQLGALNALIMAGGVAACYLYSVKGDKMLNPSEPGSYLMGFYMFVAALLFNMLANRFIRRDERLVRSADRIR